MSNNISLPMLALRGNILFPNIKTTLEISRNKTKQTILVASREDKRIFVCSQINRDLVAPTDIQDFYKAGCIAEIISVIVKDEDILEVSLRMLEPAKLLSVDATGEVFRCEVSTYEYVVQDSGQSIALRSKAIELLLKYADINKALNKEQIVKFCESDGRNAVIFVNKLANDLVLRVAERQLLLETENNETRLELLSAYIWGEMELVKAEKRIANRVKKQVEEGQKEYYLREQMKAISKELGEDENEIAEYYDRITKCNMPEAVAKKAKKEVGRLSKMAPTSPDASVIRNYVDWLCDLPWTKETTDNKDLVLARQILDEDHYGLDKIKDRIIEYLAVMQLTGKLNGPILCFVGPPGVGKTSIVKSIARALGRKYLRVSLGGVRDEAEIRGHRRTYIGAIPGKIIYMMKQAGCVNPVMLLDEIDKMGKDNRGDPASAMLEVLDPEQNYTFTDHFVEAPYDLSKVLFVCTANATDDIPEPLLDRMEIIELSGYTEYEKISIADKFLLKKNLVLHGIDQDKVTIDDDTYIAIIERYTRESGVRSLEREIAAICRKIALKLVTDPTQEIVVNKDNLQEYLGVEKYKDDNVINVDTVGSATGLAWTRVGGTTLNIDATLFEGKGEILLTGKLGDVMKESARTAISLVKSMAEQYGIPKDMFEKTDIHIHVPEGAIPKDGPSAGVTMATVILSAFTKHAVRGDIAMTGEITLRGKVLPIGGVKEKALAAYRCGIKTVIVPSDNASDLQEIPKEIASNINFVLADNIKTVFDNALVTV